jgi:hypothetical protein
MVASSEFSDFGGNAHLNLDQPKDVQIHILILEQK